MNRFDYIRPDTVSDAIKALATPASRVLAGGTNLVDLMKYDVEKPACLVDINRLPLKEISATADGGLRIGALVSNSDLAWKKSVRRGTRCCRVQSWPELPLNYGMQLRPAETCCNGRGATTSMIRRLPATSASPAPAARPSAALTGFTPFLARVTTALPSIRRTCALLWLPSALPSSRGPEW